MVLLAMSPLICVPKLANVKLPYLDRNKKNVSLITSLEIITDNSILAYWYSINHEESLNFKKPQRAASHGRGLFNVLNHKHTT